MNINIFFYVVFLSFFNVSYGQSKWEFFEETYISQPIHNVVQEGFVFQTNSNNYYRIIKSTYQRVDIRDAEVTVLYNGSQYKLVIEDFDEPVICEMLDVHTESQIDGDFEGWEGDTFFKFMNGDIWKQVSDDYIYTYSYSPRVFILDSSDGYILMVDDVESTIFVEKIN